MRLTTFSDYCMRTLIYLGLNQSERVTISDVAGAYAISENHLMKVVNFLGQQGYVETIRGKGGGMRLARSPQDINIGALLFATEGHEGLLECVEGPSSCCIQPACKLIGILVKAQAAMFAVFDKYTLADLLYEEERLEQILLFPRAASS